MAKNGAIFMHVFFHWGASAGAKKEERVLNIGEYLRKSWFGALLLHPRAVTLL